MSLPVILIILFALLLVVLLAWALRPPTRQIKPPLDVFEALSQSRHSSRMSHILQALRPADTEFLRHTGQAALIQTVRRQPKRIALNYLDQLQEEFETLLEISRALAFMTPEAVRVVALD